MPNYTDADLDVIRLAAAADDWQASGRMVRKLLADLREARAEVERLRAAIRTAANALADDPNPKTTAVKDATVLLQDQLRKGGKG